MYTAAANTDDSGILSSLSAYCPRRVWVSVLLPRAGNWLFQTGAALGEPDFDTMLEVRDYCAFGGSSVSECDDDSGPGMYSEVRRELGAQETVYLVVGGFAGRAGTFSIRAVEVEP